jgi:ATP-dependent Clp protease ATP-binding subunit ClpC
MFERFTSQSRRVVVLAQEETRMLNHNYIGSEHLLLGLLHEGQGSAARALDAAGVTLVAARDQVVSTIGRGQAEPSGHIPFTPHAKRTLELSLTEAVRLGDDYIGTGHVLLGLIHHGDNMATKILGQLGADLNDLRARVTQELRDHPEEGLKPASASASSSASASASAAAEREQRQVRLVLRDEIRGLLDTIDERLAAIEQRLHITRPVSAGLPRLDERIAQIRREKETAIDAQDFAQAAALRNAEKELLKERAGIVEEIAAAASVSAAAEAGEVGRLRDRVAGLEARLREHGIDPDEPGEPPSAAG